MSTARSRHLRKNMTEAERALWSHIRDRQIDGLRFRRQHPIGPFVVDFVCLEKRLIVELDGDVHGRHAQAVRDIERDAWLESQNFVVLRIANELAIHEPEVVTARILAALPKAASPRTTPPSPTLPPSRGKGDIARQCTVVAEAEQPFAPRQTEEPR